ncbi:MAG TPA: hypothetical protein VN081_05765 [Dongiaceae bacterium]|nr:hypothetical protein [Dongiaceae bacterium]
MKYGRRSNDLHPGYLVARILIVLALFGTFVYAVYAHAQDVSPMQLPALSPVVSHDSVSPYPINPVARNKDDLTVYLIACNDGVCYGPNGDTIGDERLVAEKLPILPYALYRTPGYRCSFVCWDAAHNVVGANPWLFGGSWKDKRS